MCGMKLKIDSFKAMLDMVRGEKELYLYGGGIIAKELLYKLSKEDRLRVRGILVSHMDGNEKEILLREKVKL